MPQRELTAAGGRKGECGVGGLMVEGEVAVVLLMVGKGGSAVRRPKTGERRW